MSARTPLPAPLIEPGPPPTLALLAVDFPPTAGGIQTLTAEIYGRLGDLTRLVVAPALPSQNVDTASGDSSLGLPVVRARRGSGRGWHTLGYLREAAALLAAQHQPPLLLHCNHLFAGYAGWWLRMRFGLPYVVWVHGEELTKSRYSMLVRSSLSAASAILTNSHFTAGRIREHIGGPGWPVVHVVPLGAPASWIAAPVSPPRNLTAGEVPVILTVARLSRRDRYKGVDMALRAMAELRRRGRALHYRIAGEGDDRGYLEALAGDLNLGAAVEFLGRVPQDQLMALYDRCDVFVLASREQRSPRGVGYEGFGIALVEAGARGRPVVGGRSGGVPDAVTDGESGLLVDPLSPAAIADGLERILTDATLRNRLAAGGRARVIEHLNWDAAARQVRDIHARLVAEIIRTR